MLLTRFPKPKQIPLDQLPVEHLHQATDTDLTAWLTHCFSVKRSSEAAIARAKNDTWRNDKPIDVASLAGLKKSKALANSLLAHIAAEQQRRRHSKGRQSQMSNTRDIVAEWHRMLSSIESANTVRRVEQEAALREIPERLKALEQAVARDSERTSTRIRDLEADLARLKSAAKVVVDAFENAEDLDSAMDWLGALVEKES
jgi:hypothetical protein